MSVDPPLNADHVAVAQRAQLAVVDQPNVSAVLVMRIRALRVHDVPGLVAQVEFDPALEPAVVFSVVIAGIVPLNHATVPAGGGRDGNEPVPIVAFVLDRALKRLRVDGSHGLDGNFGPLRDRNLGTLLERSFVPVGAERSIRGARSRLGSHRAKSRTGESRSSGSGTGMLPGLRAPELNGAGPSLNVLGGVEGGPSDGCGDSVGEGDGCHVCGGAVLGPSCGDGKPGPGVTIVPPGGGAYPGGGPP